MLDAIGTTIRELRRTAEAEIAADEASAVVVIITDGYENSSIEFSHGQISSLIRDLEFTGRWTFSYIGATLDAVEVAVSLNIKTHNAMRFRTGDTFIMYNRLDKSLNSYLNEKQSGKMTNNFLGEEGENK